MNLAVIVLLAGPLAAFATAISFALMRGEDWNLAEMLCVLTIAVLIGMAFARIGLGASGGGLPF
jgi:hypothetical protein